jgi:hypothetical protein
MSKITRFMLALMLRRKIVGREGPAEPGRSSRWVGQAARVAKERKRRHSQW